MNNNSIGILDSGLGGLTIWKEIVHQLPHESTIYIGDSLYTPYGPRTAEDIYQLATRLVRYLIAEKAKVIVIACNTITVCCVDRLRVDFPNVPIIGTVPVVKAAATITKNNRIGILSTTYTAKSTYQQELIRKFANGCLVFNHGTDKLVPFVEKGKLTGEQVSDTLREVLSQFQKENIDTLALGCTHYPFLKKEMQHILGPNVQILDSASAIARQVKRVLTNNHALSESKTPVHQFLTSGDARIAENLLSTLQGKHVPQFSQIVL